MKKILIFSDTHGDINRCLDIIEKADSVSAIFHAGDTQVTRKIWSRYTQTYLYIM